MVTGPDDWVELAAVALVDPPDEPLEPLELLELLELLPHAATIMAATSAIARTRPPAASRVNLEYIDIDLSSLSVTPKRVAAIEPWRPSRKLAACRSCGQYLKSVNIDCGYRKQSTCPPRVDSARVAEERTP
jgi:hypothetical protein